MEIGYYVFANLDPDSFRSGTKERLQGILWGGPTQQALTDAFVKAEFKWALDIVEQGLCWGQKEQAALFNTCSLSLLAAASLCSWWLQLDQTLMLSIY